MDQKFWLKRWEMSDIGFHKKEPHHYLLRFFDLLQMQPGDTFFVPLCGKSLDMIWLQEQGLNVVGIELSRAAVKAFIRENNLHGAWRSVAGLSCYCSDGYRLFCDDFFNVTPVALDGARGVYDRGALVALPSDMRAHYARHLATLLPSGSRGLLISYAYDQSETCGPPFSVDLQEVKLLFSDHFLIEPLVEDDVLWSHQGLADRGVTHLTEFAVLLIRK